MRTRLLWRASWRGRNLGLLFEPADAWIGVYCRVERQGDLRWRSVYVCVLPFLPLHYEGVTQHAEQVRLQSDLGVPKGGKP